MGGRYWKTNDLGLPIFAAFEADPALVACVAAGRPCLASYLVEEGAGDSATMRIEMVFGAPSTEGRRSTFLLAAAVAFGSAALVCAVVALVVLAG